MMVPRAFLFTAAPQATMQPCGVKDKATMPISSQPEPHSYNSISRYGLLNTNPVVIPPKRGSRTSVRRESDSRTPSKTSASSRRSSSSSVNDRPLPTSFTTMLDATAIPVPRRTWSTRRPKRFPRGNHVEDFTRMMQEGLKSKEEYLNIGGGNSPLDILLSPPDVGDKFLAGNDSEVETPCSMQSISSESVPSLEHDGGSLSSSPFPPTPASHKSPSERRHLRYSPTEDCAFDHPLLDADMDDSDMIDLNGQDEPIICDAVPARRDVPIRSFPRFKYSFKSNLTASLRAIKSAAQSVSTFATPSVQPDDFLTRSLFTITPELTDDRRPPPMQAPPPPALRRYLNPIPISPAEMYAYHDHPHDNIKSANACAVSIQMQTYRRSRGRSHRRNHFHVIPSQSRNQFYVDSETLPMSRQREPRENSDFLRVVVLEMNMRRRGKLREDIPTRARVWLPPRKSSPYRLLGKYEDGDDDTVPSRWVGVSV